MTNPAVVVLVAGWDRSRRGMDGVVEATVDPGDRAPLRVWDPVPEVLPGGGLHDVQRRHLVATARKPVGDVARVRRRVIPIDRHEPVPIQRVRVDQRSVRGADRFANVEDGLLLLPLPPGVEDPACEGPRRREEPDRQELTETARECGSVGECIENGSRPRVLPLRPIAHAVARVILEPAIRVGDLLAVHVVDHVLARGVRCERQRHAPRLRNHTGLRNWIPPGIRW